MSKKLKELCTVERFLIKQYNDHPRLSRFALAVLVALLSSLQHVIERYGYMLEFAEFLSRVGKLIALNFL